MEHVRAVPHTTGFVETLRRFSEEAILVDIFLRSYPLDFELPKDLQEKTRCVRIIQVSEDCLAVGPKRPLITALIPFDEVATIAVSSESAREDEEEVDRTIEEECPTWERDFAADMESGWGTEIRIEESQIIQTLDASNIWDYVKSENYAVVDVYAPWCQPCKEVAAVLGELAEKFGHGVLFARLDGDKNKALADELDIQAYPTVVLFEEGQLKKKLAGVRSLESYMSEIEVLVGLRKREKRRNKKANGKVNVLSSSTLVEYVDDSPASVVMLYKRRDRQCELQSRALRELAPEFKGRVLFAKADMREERELAEMFEVEKALEIHFILDGDAIGWADGRMTKAELRGAIVELLEVD